jgi:hypothetical protein
MPFASSPTEFLSATAGGHSTPTEPRVFPPTSFPSVSLARSFRDGLLDQQATGIHIHTDTLACQYCTGVGIYHLQRLKELLLVGLAPAFVVRAELLKALAVACIWLYRYLRTAYPDHGSIPFGLPATVQPRPRSVRRAPLLSAWTFADVNIKGPGTVYSRRARYSRWLPCAEEAFGRMQSSTSVYSCPSADRDLLGTACGKFSLQRFRSFPDTSKGIRTPAEIFDRGISAWPNYLISSRHNPALIPLPIHSPDTTQLSTPPRQSPISQSSGSATHRPSPQSHGRIYGFHTTQLLSGS